MAEQESVREICKSVPFATLAINDHERGVPALVPVNFVLDGDFLYFHGKRSGRKMTLICNDPRIGISIVKDYGIIPSYFSTDDGRACPATNFFISLECQGEASLIEKVEEKAKIMELLMRKYQPEGGYRPLNTPDYAGVLEATSVIRIDLLAIKYRVKLGQQLPKSRFDRIVDSLEKRNASGDSALAELMKHFRRKERKRCK